MFHDHQTPDAAVSRLLRSDAVVRGTGFGGEQTERATNSLTAVADDPLLRVSVTVEQMKPPLASGTITGQAGIPVLLMESFR